MDKVEDNPSWKDEAMEILFWKKEPIEAQVEIMKNKVKINR